MGRKTTQLVEANPITFVDINVVWLVPVRAYGFTYFLIWLEIPILI